MHRKYNDIISRIDSPPIWWEEAGVPRYDPFDTYTSTGVYANEAALAEIACQTCETTFLVLIETRNTDRSIATKIANRTLEYGDPPNVVCACGGSPSTSSLMIRVLEYWAKGDKKYVKDGLITDKRYYEWVRDNSLEIKFEDSMGSGICTLPIGPRWEPEKKGRESAPEQRKSKLAGKLSGLLRIKAQ